MPYPRCIVRIICCIEQKIYNVAARVKVLEKTISTMQTTIYSLQTTVAQLQQQVNSITGPIEELRRALIARQNTTITIETDAGSITGVLAIVGTNYIQINEPSGNIVFIPLASINGFS